jgi:hypothetical protein
MMTYDSHGYHDVVRESHSIDPARPMIVVALEGSPRASQAKQEERGCAEGFRNAIQDRSKIGDLSLEGMKMAYVGGR